MPEDYMRTPTTETAPDAPLEVLFISIPNLKPRGQGRPMCVRGRSAPIKRGVDRVYEAAIRAGWAASGSPRLRPGGYSLRVCATMKRPDSHFRQDGTLSSAGKRSPHPLRTPDADNILKSVADALSGYAFDDDARMVEAHTEKRWPKPGEAPFGLYIYARSLEN